MAETEDLKSFQCRFESDRGHDLWLKIFSFSQARHIHPKLPLDQKSLLLYSGPGIDRGVEIMTGRASIGEQKNSLEAITFPS